MTNVSMIPPNGQYGWVIVLSYAIANVSSDEIIFEIFIFKQTVASLSYLHLFARCFFQKLSVVSLMHSIFLFNSTVNFTHSLCFVYFFHLCIQFVGIPTTSNIGLIFKEKFDEMKMPAADMTLIININSTLSMAVGLLNGPLLRHFGYRKISVVAALLFSIGLMLTALTDSIFGFIINYGVITGKIKLDLTLFRSND